MFSLIIDIGINPVLVHIGPVAVHWYGLMYVVGLSLGLRVLIPYARQLGFSRDTVYDVFWPVLIASLVGGRLYYVVQSDAGWYLAHPQNIFATWEGGMAFYGAVFAGITAAFLVARRRRLNFPRMLDAASIFIPLAQAVGRLGNIVNGDIIGYSSTLPWATRYTNPANSFVPSHVLAYQPAAFYELLFSAALFAILWWWKDRFQVPGTLFTLWLVLYSLGQFALFFFRSNPVVALGLKQAQLTAIVVTLLVIPGYYLWLRHWNRRPRDGAQVEGDDQFPSVNRTV